MRGEEFHVMIIWHKSVCNGILMLCITVHFLHGFWKRFTRICLFGASDDFCDLFQCFPQYQLFSWVPFYLWFVNAITNFISVRIEKEKISKRRSNFCILNIWRTILVYVAKRRFSFFFFGRDYFRSFKQPNLTKSLYTVQYVECSPPAPWPSYEWA
jgi:hypothetical protein